MCQDTRSLTAPDVFGLNMICGKDRPLLLSGIRTDLAKRRRLFRTVFAPTGQQPKAHENDNQSPDAPTFENTCPNLLYINQTSKVTTFTAVRSTGTAPKTKHSRRPS